ncbi:MAG: hypothetical protein ACP5E3_01170 [Bacteroidales bacterium]
MSKPGGAYPNLATVPPVAMFEFRTINTSTGGAALIFLGNHSVVIRIGIPVIILIHGWDRG